MANEKRLDLVEREAVKCAIGFVNLHFLRYGENKCLLDYINDIPSADAVEVVHGRWTEHIEIGAMNNHYECSSCHWKTPSFTIARDSNFCPNCGAKMDGDGNG